MLRSLVVHTAELVCVYGYGTVPYDQRIGLLSTTTVPYVRHAQVRRAAQGYVPLLSSYCSYVRTYGSTGMIATGTVRTTSTVLTRMRSREGGG